MADPPAVPLTTMDAVNELLRAVQLREVTAYGDTPDSFNAYRALSRANTTIQAKGWHCNSEAGLVFTRNPGSNPPINTVSVDPTFLLIRPYRGGNVWPKMLTVRGGLLYDLTTHSSVFSVDPQLDVIRALDFADLPPNLRWYITCHAGRFYMPATYPTPEFYRFGEAAEQEAQSAAAHEDEIISDGALYETSPYFRNMRQR